MVVGSAHENKGVGGQSVWQLGRERLDDASGVHVQGLAVSPGL